VHFLPAGETLNGVKDRAASLGVLGAGLLGVTAQTRCFLGVLIAVGDFRAVVAGDLLDVAVAVGVF